MKVICPKCKSENTLCYTLVTTKKWSMSGYSDHEGTRKPQFRLGNSVVPAPQPERFTACNSCDYRVEGYPPKEVLA